MDKTISENYINIKAVIVALDQDYEKFEKKKVKVAGARVRNNLLNIKKLCDILRKQVLAQIKELPIKHRSQSSDDEEKETKEETKEEEKEVKEEEKKEEEMPPTEREMMEEAGEIEPVITKPKIIKKERKPRKANKKKELIIKV
jgi:hypothetical protein